jgi:Flp pilus assembly protein TadG
MRQTRRGRRAALWTGGDRGAVALEFALLSPVLFTLLLGFVWFAVAFNAQIQLSGAAREGARVMAIQNDATAARSAAAAAAPALPGGGLTTAEVTVSPAACSAGANATVTANRSLNVFWLLGNQTIDLTGVGVMRCGG